MTTRQANRRSMFLVVEQFLKDVSPTIIEQMPQFATTFSAFQAELELVSKASEQQIYNRTGLRMDKERDRLLMAEACLNVSARMRAFAKATGDAVLFEEVSGTRSFMVVKSEFVVLDYCSMVHGKAVALLSELGDYGVTQGMLDLLASRIEAYHLKIPMPRHSILERKQSTRKLAVSMQRCRELLQAMDIYVRMLEFSEPTFYMRYFFSRKQVPTGSRKLSLRGVVRDEQGVVLSGVRVFIPVLKRETVTTERGNYRFKHLPPGIYLVVFEREGFLKLSVQVAITANQRMDLSVVLEVGAVMERVG